MAQFTPNITTGAVVDASIVDLFSETFLVAFTNDNVLDQFVAWEQDIGAASIQITKYANLAIDTTPLVDGQDVSSVLMADTPILFTPAPYGVAVTTTDLTNLQTGGKINLAIPKTVGKNMARYMNKLATNALEASANVVLPGTRADVDHIVAGDVMSAAILETVYNKLARTDVPFVSDGVYVAFMHDDVISNLRASAVAGSWTDISKYTETVGQVFKNEVGQYKGFRIVRNNQASYANNAAGTPVPVYTSAFIGDRALGLAVSQPAQMIATGPYDKLGRIINIGWKAILQYAILDVDAVYIAKTTNA